MAKCLLIDGFNLIFRSFYGVPLLYRSDGLPTNAVLGWVRTISTLVDSLKPSDVCVFWDSGQPSFRQALYPEYKVNRKTMPEELRQQIAWIKKITKAMGYPVFIKDGIEADDLIASYAIECKMAGQSVCVVSSDKDLAQIIQDGIVQLLPPPTANPRLGWRTLDREGVYDKFGVYPEQIIDYLSLVGDSSDNILGVPGVGAKTARQWLTVYCSISGIIEKAAYLKPSRFQLLIPKFVEQLELNRKLITLDTTLELDVNQNTDGSISSVLDILRELEITSIKRETINKLFI